MGVINGPVNISAPGTLAPGDQALGVLAVNNALTNAGTIFIRLNKNGSTITNDGIQGVSTFVLGGTLSVTNLGPGTVTAGDSFKIFSAAIFENAFAAIAPATPGAGLVWNTSNLEINGTLSVGLGTVHPAINGVFRTGTNLTFSASGGAAGYDYSVLASSNLTVPRTNWSLVGTGIFDHVGALLFTNNVAPTAPRFFYSIRIP